MGIHNVLVFSNFDGRMFAFVENGKKPRILGHLKDSDIKVHEIFLQNMEHNRIQTLYYVLLIIQGHSVLI